MTDRTLPPPINGLEERLDVIIDLLKGVAGASAPAAPQRLPTDPEQAVPVRLREPKRRRR